jgi:hypothetical protein
MEREVSKECPQGSCCGQGFWNIHYIFLLNLKFKRWIKAVAFADDLILAIRGERVSEVEFFNWELSKITAWSKSNKVCFNEDKSKVMLIWRRNGK